MITVKLVCFSHVKHALGCDEVSLELPDGATAADVEARARQMGGEALARVPWRVAVNQAFADSGAPLAHGDEVALIPPVQGG